VWRVNSMEAILRNISRRAFLISGVASARSFVVGLQLVPRSSTAAPPRHAPGVDTPLFNPTAFVSIDADGLVTIVAHHCEMGQDVRTALPMIVADELEADWSRVRVVQGEGDEARYGGQNTDGSWNLCHFMLPMRQMGAATRHMLELAAARVWAVDVSEVAARSHEVVHSHTGRTLSYGKLVAVARAFPVPQPNEVKLKPQRVTASALPFIATS
jgi:isoquinoline 1-oxidoreductase beta subunit